MESASGRYSVASRGSYASRPYSGGPKINTRLTSETLSKFSTNKSQERGSEYFQTGNIKIDNLLRDHDQQSQLYQKSITASQSVAQASDS